tara:strand:- start:1150 stop:2283 length:1134 start_codon:yes stop_codon:yes gene_type:complete
MKTACSKSWTDVNVDFANRLIRNCCMSQHYLMPDKLTTDFFDNSPQIQNRRKDSLSGVEHSDCEHCWSDEREGRDSYRSRMNQYRSFNNLTPGNSDVRYIDVTLDTICDQSCLYCAADASSQIAQEEGVPIRDDGTEDDFEVFKTWLATLSGEVVFNFLGGEPTASKRFAPMVEYLSTLKNLTIRLELCTNCNTTPALMDRLFDIIDNSNIQWAVAISNETIGRDAELTRYGLNWERFCHNFERYATSPKIDHITLAATVNSFSIRGLSYYMEWVHSTMIRVAPNKEFSWVGAYVKHPAPMDIKYLHVDNRKYVTAAQKVIDKYKKFQKTFLNQASCDSFLSSMNDRIGSAKAVDNIREDFLKEKQAVKKKDLSSLL